MKLLEFTLLAVGLAWLVLLPVNYLLGRLLVRTSPWRLTRQRERRAMLSVTEDRYDPADAFYVPFEEVFANAAASPPSYFDARLAFYTPLFGEGHGPTKSTSITVTGNAVVTTIEPFKYGSATSVREVGQGFASSHIGSFANAGQFSEIYDFELSDAAVLPAHIIRRSQTMATAE
jgi:hypothetical protein